MAPLLVGHSSDLRQASEQIRDTETLAVVADDAVRGRTAAALDLRDPALMDADAGRDRGLGHAGLLAQAMQERTDVLIRPVSDGLVKPGFSAARHDLRERNRIEPIFADAAIPAAENADQRRSNEQLACVDRGPAPLAA
jgi:hypothetical protein